MARLGLKVALVLVSVAAALADKPTGGYDALPSAAAATVAPSVPGPNYGYDYNVEQGKHLGGHASSFGSGGYAAGAAGGGWSSGGSSVEQAQPSKPIAPYGPPGNPPTPGQSWTYHYEHYPGGQIKGGNAGGGYGPGNAGGWGASEGTGWANEETSLFGGFKGGEGGEGFGGLGSAGTALAILKGLIALKPFLLITLFVILAIPLIVIYFPLPAISWSSPKGQGRQQLAGSQGPSAIVSTYVAQLSDKFMKNDECFESIICRMPPAPAKYQGKAKLLWEQYGKKYLTSPRVRRALDAFFDETAGRSRIHKCNQKFKCAHNKYF